MMDHNIIDNSIWMQPFRISDVWKNIVIKKSGSDAPTNHHQPMVCFVEKITDDLWKLNGEQIQTGKIITRILHTIFLARTTILLLTTS